MRKLWFPFSILFFLLMLTQLAFAAVTAPAAPQPEPVIAQVIDWAIRAAGALLITLASGLLGLLIAYVNRKWHINITAAREESLDKVLDAGIHMAEEKSHNYLHAHEKALTQEQRREEALNYVLKFVQSQKWDEYGVDWINQKLHAKLGQMRAAGNKPKLAKPASPTPPKLPLRPTAA